MNLYLDLFLTFSKIGLFTFGGGYVMVSMIEDACVNRKNWITHEEMMDITVIAESTPGPIAINCATYVGYKQKGFSGALLATFAMVLPSFLIIYLISRLFVGFLEFSLIRSAFKGIKIAVSLLIFDAGLNMARKMNKNIVSFTILLCSASAMILINFFTLHFSSTSIMLIAGLLSLILAVITEKQVKNDLD